MFSKLDIFGSQIGLNFQKDNIFKTSFGGIMSIGFIAFVGIFFWTEVNNVTSNTSKDFSIDPPTVAVSTQQFMFAVKLDYPNFLTNPLFNITWERREYTTAPDGTKIKTLYPMQFEPCRVDHWTGLPKNGNVDWAQQYQDGGLQTYLCPRIQDVVKLGGSYNAYGFNFLKVQVAECKNSTDPTRLWKPNCQTKDQIDKFFKSVQSVTIMFRMNNFVINPNDPKEPIKGFIEDSLFFPVQPGTAYQTADIYFTENKLRTDQSIMPFQDIQEEQYLVYNGGNFRLQYVIGNTNKIVADFYIRKDPISYTHQRQFTKISQMASFIGGFCQTFILIAALIVNQYNGYICTFKLANKLYDFDLGEGGQNQDNNGRLDTRQMSTYGPQKTITQQQTINRYKSSTTMNFLNGIRKEEVKQAINRNTDSPQINHIINTPQIIPQERKLTHKKTSSLLQKPKTREEGGLLSLDQIKHMVEKQGEIQSGQINQPYPISNSSNNIVNENTKRQFTLRVEQFDNAKNEQKFDGNNQLEQISVIDQSILPELPMQDIRYKNEINTFNDTNVQQSPNQQIAEQNFQLSSKRDNIPLDVLNSCKRDSSPLKENSPQINRKESQKENNNMKKSRAKISSFAHTNTNTIKIENRAISQSTVNNQELLDEKHFLKKEFEFLTQRDKSIKLTYKYFLYKLTCGKCFKSKQVALLDKAQQMMEKEMDIFMILNGIKELQKFKDLYLDKEQQILFNFFPKPVISIDSNQELPSRVHVDEKKKEINQSIKVETKKESQLLQNHSRKLNLSLRVASLVQKASSKLKKPLGDIKNRNITYNNIDAYLKLYDAFNTVSKDGQSMIQKNKERVLMKSKYVNMWKKQIEGDNNKNNIQNNKFNNNNNKNIKSEININNDVNMAINTPRIVNPMTYVNETELQEQCSNAAKTNQQSLVHLQLPQTQIISEINTPTSLLFDNQQQLNSLPMIIEDKIQKQNNNKQLNHSEIENNNNIILFDEQDDYQQSFN